MTVESRQQDTAKPTPGPWRYRDTGWGAYGIYCDGYRAAEGPIGLLGRTSQNEPTDEANARLIAAAPDLLEALEALGRAAAAFLLELDDYEFSGPVPAQDKAATLDAMLGNARAAIQKARTG
jgi:hypothetical protein